MQNKKIDYRSLLISGIITVILMALFQMGFLLTILVFLGIYKSNEYILSKKRKDAENKDN